MSYTPTKWVNGVTPLNAQNMNKIEQGIKDSNNLVSNYSLLPSTNQIQNFFNLSDINNTGNAVAQALDNGYVLFYYQNTSGITVTITLVDTNTGITSGHTVGHFGTFTELIPVAKGDNVILYISKGNFNKLTVYNNQFIYAKKV